MVIALVTLIAVFLMSQALPALAKNKVNFLTSTQWNVDGTPLQFGIANLLWVTVLSSAIAMVIAVPFGVGVALFITQYAPGWLSRPAATLVDLLAAVPSIVYGLWGLQVLGPHMHGVQAVLLKLFGWIPLFKETGVDAGSTILTVAVVLSIMVLPIVTALSREVFAQTPTSHKDAALALGATRWEMIRTAVLPFGKPGVISASMLGLGRAPVFCGADTQELDDLFVEVTDDQRGHVNLRAAHDSLDSILLWEMSCIGVRRNGSVARASDSRRTAPSFSALSATGDSRARR